MTADGARRLAIQGHVGRTGGENNEFNFYLTKIHVFKRDSFMPAK